MKILKVLIPTTGSKGAIMVGVKVSELVEATGGQLLCGKENTVLYSVSIDSQKLHPGDVFVPLKGETRDGHEFIADAIANDCCGVLISKKFSIKMDKEIANCKQKGLVVIVVRDTLKALQDWATLLRAKFEGHVVGITGSAGKTTTKDMLRHILGAARQVAATPDNFNNEIGLPLSIFGLHKDTEILVLEFGMRGLGEIKALAEIARPDTAIITNIGHSHFELLKSRENIAKAKAELLDSLPLNGQAILNADDSFFSYLCSRYKGMVTSYGVRNKADVMLKSHTKVSNNLHKLEIKLKDIDLNITANIVGEHHFHNLLAAIACASHLGLTPDQIKLGIDKIILSSHRMRVIKLDEGIYVIDDCYNASPESMMAALKVLAEFDTPGVRFAVLGDMLELGSMTDSSHEMIGKECARLNIDFLLTIGKHGEKIAHSAIKSGMPRAQVFSFQDNIDVFEVLADILDVDDVVLFKASRRIGLEEVIFELIDYFEGIH